MNANKLGQCYIYEDNIVQVVAMEFVNRHNVIYTLADVNGSQTFLKLYQLRKLSRADVDYVRNRVVSRRAEFYPNLLGHPMKKMFASVYYFGYVKHMSIEGINHNEDLVQGVKYSVYYEDGDEEDHRLEDIVKYLIE
jgi:hypothetical protein